MSWRHDSNSSESDMIKDISDKHCPDSVRESAYRELRDRGISHSEAQKMADKKHGDFWG